jgi:hypothetical protein
LRNKRFDNIKNARCNCGKKEKRKKSVCGVYLLAAGRMEIGTCALGAKGK